MKAMGKSAIHLAVAATVLGVSATVGIGQSQAATYSQGNVGQALVFPYYTVNEGWQTNFNIMNTTDNFLAVKVRFHERKNSRDVLDFNLVLSPYDSWTGWVQDSDQGTELHTTDKSCTSPQVVDGAHASQIAYTGQFDDTGGQGLNRIREGYVEVLLMGVAAPDSPGAVGPADPTTFNPNTAFTAHADMYVPYYAQHVDGVPRDCGIVDQAFVATALTWTAGDAAANAPTAYVYSGAAGQINGVSLGGSGDPLARIDFVAPTAGTNYLKGNVSWLHANTGAGAGSQALALADYNSGVAGNASWVTAQQFPWFLEPTFASDPTFGGVGLGLWTITGAANFEGAFSATSVFNEWSNNPANGAATDWVITFPTKGYHVDAFNDQIQAAYSKYRHLTGAPAAPTDVVTCTDATDRGTCAPVDTGLGGSAPLWYVAPFEHLFGVQAAVAGRTNDGDSNITVTYHVYDREEGEAAYTTTGTSISPAPPADVNTLRFEANVLQLGDSSALSANTPAVVDLSGLSSGSPNGWARVSFTGAGAVGLPAYGMAVKVRDHGETNSAYGQAMDHGYAIVR
jgi:hypothetical protein